MRISKWSNATKSETTNWKSALRNRKKFSSTDKLDEEVMQDGARILIDKKAQLSLLGTEMDFVENKLSAEFVFNNPNIKGTCGCGESFSL